jgi:hypothetical protein
MSQYRVLAAEGRQRYTIYCTQKLEKYIGKKYKKIRKQ